MYSSLGASGSTLAFTGALATGHWVVAAMSLIALGTVLVRLARKPTH